MPSYLVAVRMPFWVLCEGRERESDIREKLRKRCYGLEGFNSLLVLVSRQCSDGHMFVLGDVQPMCVLEA
jgi:hypothetical protein